MNPHTGEVRPLGDLEEPRDDEVLIVGDRESVMLVSAAVKAQRRRRNKAARKARRRNR